MCDYTFHPDVWEERYDAAAVPTDDRPCSRPTIPGSKFCKYHAETADRRQNGKSDDEVFLDLLSEEEDIFGAKFQDVKIRAGDLEGVDREWVELKNVVIHNSLRIEAATLNIQLTFNCCDIYRYKERETISTSYLEFDSCWFQDEFVINPAETSADILFNNSHFTTPLLMSGNYGGSVSFHCCSLEKGAAIWNAKFNGEFRFEDGSVDDDLLIDDVDLKEDFKLTDVDLPAVNIISDCNINSIKCNPEDGYPSLVDFRKGTTLHSGRLLVLESESVYYDLSLTTIGNIHLSTGVDDLANYYFEDTRFDGFDFFPYRTQLEAEDFQLHIFDFPYNETDNHEINDYPQISSQREVDGSDKGKLKDQEETYARAKIQAQNMGASRFASEFFFNQKEAELLRMKDDLTLSEETLQEFEIDREFVPERFNKLVRYRGQLYSDICTNFSIWVKKLKYKGLKYSCGYGEKASYPIYWSVSIVVIFGLLYPFVGGTTQSGSIIVGSCTSDCLGLIELLSIFGESLFFSGITFASLSFGGNGPVGILAQLMAMIQAFLGALFIALFVFTLGRQVSR
ncbi:potassium channel family protein [Halorhabdus sp. CUG00001]|uniref:potassium channel family protein n=1 Tax=Halorhabdus sp. CUG00001 TaxID=2600297 RepID=UPI00131E665D|nr:potassium channel family protein [Halorhabdus sp. CUG00001]